MENQKNNEIKTRATHKQIRAFAVINRRIHADLQRTELNKFGQLALEDASQVLGEMMKAYPAPVRKAPTTQVVATPSKTAS